MNIAEKNKFVKAKRLLSEKRIWREGPNWFVVKGDKDTHSVRFAPDSCDCKYFSLKGTTQGKICSHIIAVRLFVSCQDLLGIVKPIRGVGV